MTPSLPEYAFPSQERIEARTVLPEALRSDVRLLGGLLGRVLVESGGRELFDDVETLRALTIRAYDEEGSDSIDEAERVVASWTQERAEGVARAFTCYFHLVNLAEEHQRVRVLRERDKTRTDAPEDSIPAAFAQLVAEVGEESALERLAGLEFRPVLTAHPTEARRRAISTTIRRISELLDQRDDVRLGGVRLRENQRRLLEEIDTLWRTAPLRQQKPTPVDEVRTAMAIFDDTLFQTLPAVYRRVDEELQGELSGRTSPIVPAFVRLGTWIGGDRDGNPNVTAAITRQAAGIASEHVLMGLERATSRIGRTLTMDGTETVPSPELLALWDAQVALAPTLAEDIGLRAPGEPHRRVVLFVAARLRATRSVGELAYGTPEELLADLRVVQGSLIAAGGVRAAYGELQHLIWQVESFGFHLAELEVRQHSQVHAEALAEIEAGGELSERTLEVLEVFRAIREIQDRSGERAARRYIVSFTRSSQDLINVSTLAAHALGSPEAAPALDVIPLFETFADLQAATTILGEMLELPGAQERLDAAGRRVEVMLGYSDSSKDVGPVAATLALYDAQAKIADWALDNDITLTLFHGRGGALGRGGGPANSAILGQPPRSVDGRFKLTEQGEVIFARYSDPVIATRHIEQVAAATLLASAPSTEERIAAAASDFAPLAEIMDRASRERFFELVKAPGFAPWFAQVTPMEEVGLLSLGSRPARRGLSVESLEDLRAIPWVFAWTQARINLTGWFGLGTALAAVGDVDALHDAYSRWPLFRTMIDNVAMSLAKTDERIAQRYLDLGDRDDLASLVMDELRLTATWITTVTGESELLEKRPILGRAVTMRSPYVDALSLLQLRALRALRRHDEETPVEALQRLLLLSVNGVAAGLQNTG